MKILNKSVIDVSLSLDFFTKTLNGCNYVVYGDLVKFEYEGLDVDFNLETLKDIYNKLPQNISSQIAQDPKYESIDGEIKKTSWASAVEDINKKLKYTASGEGIREAEDIFLDILSEEKYKERKKIFWEIVKKEFENLPPDAVFVHIPYYPSYFHFFVMWGFCYIFLKDGKGLVLHAGASD